MLAATGKISRYPVCSASGQFIIYQNSSGIVEYHTEKLQVNHCDFEQE